MVDRIGYQIIDILNKDGRCSYARLARELDINVATVVRRIEALLEEDVIAFKAVPNPYKMGYQAHAFITLDVDLSKVDDVCSKLIDNHNLSLMVTAFGRFGVLFTADFINLEALQNFCKTELPQIDGINQINTFLVSEIKKTYDGIFENNKNGPSSPIDAINQKLIEELQENGRASYIDLADKLGISLATVSRRVNSLIKENIIKITAVPNTSQLGYSSDAFIALRSKPSKINYICTQLSKEAEVHLVMTLMTGFDILVGIHSPNPEVLFNFIKEKIAKLDGVSYIETFVQAEIKRRYYGLFEINRHI